MQIYYFFRKVSAVCRADIEAVRFPYNKSEDIPNTTAPSEDEAEERYDCGKIPEKSLTFRLFGETTI